MISRERRSVSMLLLGMLHAKWWWGDFEAVFYSVGAEDDGA